jgi:hypothetical protein
MTMTALTTFDPNDPRLTAYALSELDEQRSAKWTPLVDASPAMRDDVTQIRHFAELLRAELKSEPMPTLTASQRSKLRRQMTGAVLDERPTQQLIGRLADLPTPPKKEQGIA